MCSAASARGSELMPTLGEMMERTQGPPCAGCGHGWRVHGRYKDLPSPATLAEALDGTKNPCTVCACEEYWSDPGAEWREWVKRTGWQEPP
jgi:hypothetical protein